MQIMTDFQGPVSRLSEVDISAENKLQYYIKIRLFHKKSMNINIKSIKGEDCACDALIFLFPESGPEGLKKLPQVIAPLIRQVFSKEFSGKQNEVFLMKAPDTVKPERLLLVGLGKREQISAEKIRQAGGKAATYLREHGYEKGRAVY